MSTLANLKLNLTQLESAAGIQYKEQRLDYDTDGNLTYKGLHLNYGASQSDTNWFVWKFTWTSGNLVRIQGPVITPWSERGNM